MGNPVEPRGGTEGTVIVTFLISMTCEKIPFSDNVYPYWQTVPAGGIQAGSGTSVRIVLSLVGPIINAAVMQTIQLSTHNPGTRPKSRWLPDNSKASWTPAMVAILRSAMPI